MSVLTNLTFIDTKYFILTEKTTGNDTFLVVNKNFRLHYIPNENIKSMYFQFSCIVCRRLAGEVKCVDTCQEVFTVYYQTQTTEIRLGSFLGSLVNIVFLTDLGTSIILNRCLVSDTNEMSIRS